MFTVHSLYLLGIFFYFILERSVGGVHDQPGCGSAPRVAGESTSGTACSLFVRARRPTDGVLHGWQGGYGAGAGNSCVVGARQGGMRMGSGKRVGPRLGG